MLGIVKGDKHSYNDFGLTIKSKKIGLPAKNTIKEKVPFQNGSYDFSNLYGFVSYDDRVIEYVFNLNCRTKYEMNSKLTNVLDWLNSDDEKLYDDSVPGFYFIASLETHDFTEKGHNGELKVAFSAYPFKISSKEEGNDIFDIFNFELDMVQDVEINVSGSKDIALTNPGFNSVCPIIEVRTDSSFNIIFNDEIYVVSNGTFKDDRFVFSKGENNISLRGFGSVKFKFYKEVL